MSLTEFLQDLILIIGFVVKISIEHTSGTSKLFYTISNRDFCNNKK